MRALFSPAPIFLYFPTVVTLAMFHSSTGESLRWYKFPNCIASSAHRKHRHMMSVFPAEAIQLTSLLAWVGSFLFLGENVEQQGAG